jgi:hypothetical protein
LCVRGTERAVFHPSGAWDSEVAGTFFEKLCTHVLGALKAFNVFNQYFLYLRWKDGLS